MEITIKYKIKGGYENNLIIEDGSESFVDFILNIDHLRSLYRRGKFTNADEFKNNLCVQLDDLMREEI
ncbi:MAG: hypothetical protein KA347_06645 [Bacteroidia bacterium]|nr:hypothetical protein [Bacteroidia bacterium]